MLTHNTFRATGMSHYKKAFKEIATENDDYRLTKKQMLEEYFDGDKIYKYDFSFCDVKLVPEPDNEFDPNAIAVIADGQKIAYIKRNDCKKVKALLDSPHFAYIEAEINGGNYKEIDDEDIFTDTQDYYVHIDICLRVPDEPAEDTKNSASDVPAQQEEPAKPVENPIEDSVEKTSDSSPTVQQTTPVPDVSPVPPVTSPVTEENKKPPYIFIVILLAIIALVIWFMFLK